VIEADDRSGALSERRGARLPRAIEKLYELPGPNVPQTCTAWAGGHDPPAIGTELRVSDRTKVTLEAMNGDARGRIPDSSVMVTTRANEQSPVGAERNRLDHIAVTTQ
jgi:hypothetical protein